MSEIKHVLGIGKVIFDTNNKPLKVKGTVQDITERKIAENKITLSAIVCKSAITWIWKFLFKGA